MKITFGISAIFVAVALFVTHSVDALACIIAAILHEVGHIIAAKFRKIDFKELKLSALGATLIPLESMGSFFDEIVISIAGPTVNIFFAVITYGICSNSFIMLFNASSLFLGILNLLPIYGFDGGRIAFSILEYKFSYQKAKIIVNASSFIIVFFLWILSLYFIIRATATLSLFIFSCSLFSRLFIQNNT